MIQAAPPGGGAVRCGRCALRDHSTLQMARTTAVRRYSTERSVQPVTAVPAIEHVCTLFAVKTTYEVSFVTYTLPASPVGATAVMVRHPENPASAPTSMLAAMNRLIGSSLSLNGLEHPYRAGMVLQLRADYPQFVHAERSGILRACA